MDLNFTVRSMADPFVIIDGHGQACYRVRTVPDVAERLSLRAVEGRELAVVMRDAMSAGFRVFVAGEQAALVRARGLRRRRYLVEAPGDSLWVTGDVYRGAYAVCTDAGPEQALRAQVWRQKFGPRYTVRLLIADDQDQLLLTAVILALEYLYDDHRVSIDELRMLPALATALDRPLVASGFDRDARHRRPTGCP
jgi:uncharacterized protein YxjI